MPSTLRHERSNRNLAIQRSLGVKPFCLDGTGRRDDPSLMDERVRPLIASHMRVAIDRPIPGAYDQTRQLRLDQHGSPIVASRPVGETATAVRTETPDPSDVPMWLLETETRVVQEDPDDYLAMTETSTKTRAEPADAGAQPSVTLPADDSVTGIVAF
jgi:hypothetical protein